MATDVSAALPDLELAPGATITVSLDDASAIVTQLNVYGISPAGEPIAIELQPVPSIFAYAPTA